MLRLRLACARFEVESTPLMNTTVFITFWLIVLARITDVTLETIRIVAIVQGRVGSRRS